MKVLYLFTSYRGEVYEKALRGEDHGNGFWGMLRLPHYGVDAGYLELEHFFSRRVARTIRKHLDVYWVHLPLYWKFFSYDIVFTSTAFGTQLVHTLLHVRKPRWVMHDFSITGLLGEEKTRKQKIFRYMVERCAGIVVVSQEEKKLLQERFPHLASRIECIPWGVDINYFKPQPVPEILEVFSPGRDPDRDFGVLFSACEKVGVPVVVTTHLNRLEKFQPLPSFVQHRNLSHEEYLEEYTRAAVVVIPLNTKSGLNNAMGTSVLLEAMAMGKAVVATRTSTMESYIVDGENGLLVPEGDTEALEHALTRVFSDPLFRKKLGDNARRLAENKLDAEKLAEELASFFRRLV